MNRLEQTGIGTHIGAIYVGAPTCADDIALDPVCVSIRPSFLFIDVSAIGLSETRYHTIVKICRQSGEFTGVDFSRLKASVTARLIPMN